MNDIKLYSRSLCGWCQEAKAYLKEHGIAFTEIDASQPDAFAEMVKLSGQKYVPTIVVNGQVLADFDVTQLEKFLSRFNE